MLQQNVQSGNAVPGALGAMLQRRLLQQRLAPSAVDPIAMVKEQIIPHFSESLNPVALTGSIASYRPDYDPMAQRSEVTAGPQSNRLIGGEAEAAAMPSTLSDAMQRRMQTNAPARDIFVQYDPPTPTRHHSSGGLRRLSEHLKDAVLAFGTTGKLGDAVRAGFDPQHAHNLQNLVYERPLYDHQWKMQREAADSNLAAAKGYADLTGINAYDGGLSVDAMKLQHQWDNDQWERKFKLDNHQLDQVGKLISLVDKIPGRRIRLNRQHALALGDASLEGSEVFKEDHYLKIIEPDDSVTLVNERTREARTVIKPSGQVLKERGPREPRAC